MHLIIDNGLIHTRPPGVSALTLQTTPVGVDLRAPRPSFAKFRRRTFINGRFIPGLVHDDFYNTRWRLGFETPLEAPTLATQGTGITGSAIAYYTEAHYIGPNDEVLAAESDFSPASATITLTNQGRRHTTPSFPLNPRSNYKHIWVSMDGLLMRRVAKIPWSVTTYDEAVATSTLVNLTAPPVNSDGTLNSQARTAPPYCRFNKVYHDRVWYAGDPIHPERAYYSLIEEGEAVGPLAWIPTKGLEAITGFGANEDTLVAFTYAGMYDIQGYAGGPYPDFTMRRIPGPGCISHYGVITRGRIIYYPTVKGYWAFDGAARRVMADYEDYWIAAYKANKENYENCQAELDEEGDAIRVTIPGATGFMYTGQFPGNDQDEERIDWVLDTETRDVYTFGRLWSPNSQEGVVHQGGSDGWLRKDDATNVDDDADVQLKPWVIRPGHRYVQGQYGGRNHGLSVKEGTLYFNIIGGGTLTVRCWGGEDPQQALAAAPTWGPHTIVFTAKTSSKFIRPTKLSGKGFAWEFRMTSVPAGSEYRGVSWDVAAGPAGRRT